MKRTIISALCVILAALMLFGAASCGGKKEGIDYLVLVNKENKLPSDWEQKLETVTVRNSLGDEVEAEKAAYDAYLKLKAALEAEDVHVDLDSARRSVAAQQRIWDDFMEKYGEVYTKRTVAVPGYSEHHTGLALDLYLNINGEDVYYNEDMVQYPEIWAKIHAKLADFGFILRYLEGKEAITGYGYEPWHIRYLGSVGIAKEITEKGITFEEYLGKLPAGNVAPPAEDESEAVPDYAAIYGQDPAAAMVGNYYSDETGLTAAVSVLENGALRFLITKNEGLRYAEWSMTGAPDDSLELKYSDGVMKEFELNEDRILVSEDLKYKDSSGTVTFNKDSIGFTWNEAASEQGAVKFVPASENGNMQNPVMNFIGNYVSGRASATVAASGKEDARITVTWSGSSDSRKKWVMSGKFDTETLTVIYHNACVSEITYDSDGTVVEETVIAENGAGSVTFKEEGLGFFWNDEQLTEQDMEFTWSAQS